MDKEKAIEAIRKTPQFISASCPWCGAASIEEAGKLCRPVQLPSGDYECGTPECEENEKDKGFLFQVNPEYQKLDGYLWGWYAFEEGLTKTLPKWNQDIRRWLRANR